MIPGFMPTGILTAQSAEHDLATSLGGDGQNNEIALGHIASEDHDY